MGYLGKNDRLRGLGFLALGCLALSLTGCQLFFEGTSPSMPSGSNSDVQTQTTAGATATTGVAAKVVGAAAAPQAQPSRTTLLFSDSFSAPAEGTLGGDGDWTGQVGGFSVAQSKVTAANPNADAIATVDGSYADNYVTQVEVDISGGSKDCAGAAGRYLESGKSFYAGVLCADGDGQSKLAIYYVVPGSWTLLAWIPVAASTGTLVFTLVGDRLTLALGDQTVAAWDARLSAGLAGIVSHSGSPSLANFSIFGLDSIPLPFSDSFSAADESSLGAEWVPEVLDFVLASQGATSVLSGIAELLLAQQPSDQVADVTLTATVTFLGDSPVTQCGGPAARHTVTANGPSEYWGVLCKAVGIDSANLGIYRRLNGTWALIAETSAHAASGTLTFVVKGTSLSLTLGNGSPLTITDGALTAAGAVGIYATNSGVAFTDFTASAAK